jgi:hypothetical protein
VKSHKRLETAEMIEILEDVVRTGSTSSKIQALRLLRELRGELEKEKGDVDDEFADLDAVPVVELAKQREKRRRKRATRPARRKKDQTPRPGR